MLLLDEQGNEMLLPKTEQIPTDFYRKGDTVKAVVVKVDNKNNNLKIIVSRTSPVFFNVYSNWKFLKFKKEQLPLKDCSYSGERAKVAVESYDDQY